jgi:hypothetical protein
MENATTLRRQIMGGLAPSGAVLAVAGAVVPWPELRLAPPGLAVNSIAVLIRRIE